MTKITVKGEGGGVPWVQIMENEFEYLVDRGGHGGHLAEKFLKNIVPGQSYRDSAVVTRRRLAITITAIILKPGFLTFKCL